MYYVTFTIHQWADDCLLVRQVFTSSCYIDIIIDSSRNCQKEKGFKN
jgi:hypothetical protein